MPRSLIFLLLAACGGGGKADFPHGFALQPKPVVTLVKTSPLPWSPVVPVVTYR